MSKESIELRWRVVPWRENNPLRTHHLHRLHGTGNWALKLMFYCDAWAVRKHINLKTKDVEEAIRIRDRIYSGLVGRVVRDVDLDRKVGA